MRRLIKYIFLIFLEGGGYYKIISNLFRFDEHLLLVWPQLQVNAGIFSSTDQRHYYRFMPVRHPVGMIRKCIFSNNKKSLSGERMLYLK